MKAIVLGSEDMLAIVRAYVEDWKLVNSPRKEDSRTLSSGHSAQQSDFPELAARSLRSAMQTMVGSLRAATLGC